MVERLIFVKVFSRLFAFPVKSCKSINILQRVSSDPSEQSISPSHTFVFNMHCLLEHVASFKPHASMGRAVISTPEINVS